jgi:transcriptional regulator with XRE-family HTH domain
MGTINERFAKVVEESGISRTAFAEKIHVSQQYVSKLAKMGMPSDSTIADICREFSVNEEWLRTGDGEMYIPKTRDDEIAEFYADLMKGVEPTFKRRLVAALARLDESQWETLEKVARQLVGEEDEKEKGPPE